MIWSLSLGARSKESAEGPWEKGAVFGSRGLAGDWEAVSCVLGETMSLDSGHVALGTR